MDGRLREILVYSPLVVNQEANRPTGSERRKLIWSIIPNASEISSLEESEINSGESLPWKLAMWGIGRDNGLIKKIERRFKSFKSLNKSWQLKIHEGLQLRGLKSGEETESIPQVIGKKRLIPKKLAKRTNLHTFPGDVFELVPKDEGFVRKGRKEKPLIVCYPPHVVVSAARTFAVYSDEFLVIPPRQIGIAGPAEKSSLLKSLALYLSSDFARYYEFFTAPQWGIRDGRSTLDTLKQLPVPWSEPAESDLTEWTELHQELAAISAEENEQESGGPLFAESKSSSRLAALNRELNRKVEDLLGLSDRQRWLVHDLIHVRLHLTDGKLGNPAIRRPSGEDLERYATTLRDELDAFLANELGLVHRVTIRCGTTTGAVEVELVSRTGDRALPCMIHERDDAVTLPPSRTVVGTIDLGHQGREHRRTLAVGLGMKDPGRRGRNLGRRCRAAAGSGERRWRRGDLPRRRGAGPPLRRTWRHSELPRRPWRFLGIRPSGRSYKWLASGASRVGSLRRQPAPLSVCLSSPCAGGDLRRNAA